MAISPFLRPLGITAAIFAIIQGVVWSILTLMAILIYVEAWKIKANKSTYGHHLSTVIVIRFFTGANEKDIFIGPQLLFIWSILYLIASLFWISLSSYLLWVVLQQKFKLLKKSYSAWANWTFLICIVDLIVTALLASDYNVQVGKSNSKGNASTKEDYIKNLAVGVVMALVARGFILWIINVIFSIIIMKLSIDLPKKMAEEDFNSNTLRDTDTSRNKPNFTRSNSFISSQSFGTFQGLPRLPPVQSTNERLTRLGRHSMRLPSENGESSPPPSTNPTYLYPSSMRVSPEYASPRSPPQPPLKSALKNRAQSPYR